jgi:hypothetical protein
MIPVRTLKIFLLALITAGGLLFAAASSASATTIPVTNGNVQMNLFLSGRHLDKMNMEVIPYVSGDSAVRWSFHGMRTVSGGQSQAVGPQPKEFGVCSDASMCFKSFNVNFTYACGDWVYADISVQRKNGTYASIGTPVYRFTC